MNDRNLARLLGAMFLIVDVTSLAGGMLLASVTGGVFAAATISQVLTAIAGHVELIRAAVLADLATSIGELALAVLLYVVLRNQGRVLALLALACFIGEALSLAFSKIGLIALIPLSQQFVAAGAPANSFYQPLADFLYTGIVMHMGATTQMFFYCAGGLVWYSLFYRSRYIPRAISAFGVAAVAVGLVGILFEFSGFSVPSYVYIPILPFELLIGAWLLVRGITEGGEASAAAAAGRRAATAA
jgi:hypothetical protein